MARNWSRTPANGSFRVRQGRRVRSAPGGGPASRYLRAVLASIPTDSAALESGIPDDNSFISFLT